MSNPHIKPADFRTGAAGTPVLVGGTAGTILGEGEGAGVSIIINGAGAGAGTWAGRTGAGAGTGGNCGGDDGGVTPRIARTTT